jgi:hypothetical protein
VNANFQTFPTGFELRTGGEVDTASKTRTKRPSVSMHLPHRSRAVFLLRSSVTDLGVLERSEALLIRTTRDKLHDDGERREASACLGFHSVCKTVLSCSCIDPAIARRLATSADRRSFEPAKKPPSRRIGGIRIRRNASRAGRRSKEPDSHTDDRKQRHNMGGMATSRGRFATAWP